MIIYFIRENIMNFKRSFLVCLSILFVSVSATAMEDEQEDTPLNQSFVQFMHEDDDTSFEDYEVCQQCLQPLVPSKDGLPDCFAYYLDKPVVLPSCSHKLHGYCWHTLLEQEKNLCPKNGCATNIANALPYRGNASYWRKRFRDNGILDINEVPEMKDKTVDQIIDYFVNLQSKNKLMIRCFCYPKYAGVDEKYERVIVFDSGDGGWSEFTPTPYMMKDNEGKQTKVGIINEDLCIRFDEKCCDVFRDIYLQYIQIKEIKKEETEFGPKEQGA